MRTLIRTSLIFSTIMLGWINLPAQAYLLSDEQNLWPVMSQQFTIPANSKQADVQKQLNWDLHNPKYIHRLSENARPYLFYVFQETKKLHLPAELALLPMIESDYLPRGSSSMGAAGLWQLMPGLAADYGIKMNSFYDGRRSTTVSTRVALHFLSYLYQVFDHNWLLALAAYNSGPGTVMAAIQHNKERGLSTSFWALPLPKQTQDYIPKLLALATIIQNPKAYGIHLAPVPNKPLTTTVTINKQMELKTIATLAHTSVHTVKKLNPALKKSITPPHQVVTLVIPGDNKKAFVQNLKAQKDNPKKAVAIKKTTHTHVAKKTTHTHTAHNHPHLYAVKRGEDLNKLAARYHTTAKHLMAINHLHHSTLQIGQKLRV